MGGRGATFGQDFQLVGQIFVGWSASLSELFAFPPPPQSSDPSSTPGLDFVSLSSSEFIDILIPKFRSSLDIPKIILKNRQKLYLVFYQNIIKSLQ